MTITIALAGKGGVGKTTLSALIIRYLAGLKAGPVLAVDADPSSNLNLLLGLDLDATVSQLREGMLDQVKQTLTQGGAAMGTLPGGQTKHDYLDLGIRNALVEGQDVDLLAMGRGEGPGCYCAVNHNLREVLDAVSRSYAFVVIDNEAGLEHLSRRTTRGVQHLFIVSDAGPRGLVTAERVAAFRHEIDIAIEHTHLIVNRAPATLPAALTDKISALDVPLAGVIPADPGLTALELEGRPVWDATPDMPAVAALTALLDRVLTKRA